MLSTEGGVEAVADIVGRSRIVVLVPCYNEEAAIGKVVTDFRAALPEADVYVYDNNSRDRTVELAAKAGAVTRREARQGKGYVVRRMFTDINADIYVLVDGDATYDAPSARAMTNSPEWITRCVNRRRTQGSGRRDKIRLTGPLKLAAIARILPPPTAARSS